ncbi:MAG: hypothetical protein C0483_24580 [Pirellula sp.]|nr:hypothetical protein [Pirellula sp.]
MTSSRTSTDAAPKPTVAGYLPTVFALVAAALLLFWNLGFYPFWGDEADTVIFARGVWETGDMSALYGENLYAYRDGTLLVQLKNRSTPPAAYYLVAPFWGTFGPDHFGLRLPFALCTLGVVALVGRWLVRESLAWPLQACLLGALVLNVSFLLYGRQCRYSALATLLTAAVAYCYWFFDGSRRKLAAVVVGLCLLAATHYLHFAAGVAALLVDYVLCGRRTMRLSARQWTAVLLPTAIVFALLVAVYNPLGKHTQTEPVAGAQASTNILLDKAKLLWWSLRDLNGCEYGVGIVLAAAPLVFLWRKSWGPLRLWLACFVYIVATTLLSPQPVDRTLEADVRYLAPLIPALIALTVLAVERACGGRMLLAAPITALCVFTNMAHKPWDPFEWPERITKRFSDAAWVSHPWRSTIGDFVHELYHPRRTAGAALSQWLKENARPGDTAWLTPSDWMAPQIIETPELIYGWQLERPAREADFAALPRIHFAGEVPVDWIVVFGFGNVDTLRLRHVKENVLPRLAARGFHYDQAAHLSEYFDDRTRPELFWHWFRDEPYDKTNRGITIFRLRQP